MADLVKSLCSAFCPPAADNREGQGSTTRDGPAAGSGPAGIPPGLQNIIALATGQAKPPDPKSSREEYRSRVAQVLPADVRMFSGCQDNQTSADVGDSTVFSLPPDAGPGGAGGACTNALLQAIERNPTMAWKDLLADMCVILKLKHFTQVPQLSASKDISLSTPFVIKKSGQGRTKALFIGINYVGHNPGELKGCHNDVEKMRRFVAKQGYDEANMKFLMDDGKSTPPTKQEILTAIKWLVQGARDGDSLFFHYSGHGTQVPDESGDETDGKDEALVPVDYQKFPGAKGMIIDDDLVKELVMPLPEGVMLTAVMDCCHSGTILDMPYEFTANDSNMQAGSQIALKPNAQFDFSQLVRVAMALYEMHKKGAGSSEILQQGLRMVSQKV
jgi:metacaspase-1